MCVFLAWLLGVVVGFLLRGFVDRQWGYLKELEDPDRR